MRTQFRELGGPSAFSSLDQKRKNSRAVPLGGATCGFSDFSTVESPRTAGVMAIPTIGPLTSA